MVTRILTKYEKIELESIVHRLENLETPELFHYGCPSQNKSCIEFCGRLLPRGIYEEIYEEITENHYNTFVRCGCDMIQDKTYTPETVIRKIKTALKTGMLPKFTPRVKKLMRRDGRRVHGK